MNSFCLIRYLNCFPYKSLLCYTLYSDQAALPFHLRLLICLYSAYQYAIQNIPTTYTANRLPNNTYV